MHDDPQAERLRALEQRVAHLEQLLHVRPAPSPAVPPPVTPPLPGVTPLPLPSAPLPPPLPTAAAPSAPVAARKDLESFVGLAVLGRVGAAALVLAAAYFGQLGWTQLGPVARVSVVYAGAALLIALGLLLRERVALRYSALLCGAGVALGYLAGVLACLHYELLPSLPAMALLFGTAAVGQWLGWRLRIQVLATVALAGAYAAPVLVGTPSATPTGLFAVCVLLHTWAAWTQWRWSWHQARVLAVAATAALVVLWYGRNGIVSPASLVLHLELVLLCVAAPEWLAVAGRRPVAGVRWGAFVVGAAAVQLVLLQQCVWHRELVGFGLVVGAAWLTAAAWLVRTGAAPAAGVARLGGVLVALGALMAWVGADLAEPALARGRVLSTSAAALLLLALRRVTSAGELASVLAALLALNVVLEQDDATVRRQLVAVVVPTAVVLLWWARRPAPVFALGIGVVAALFGVCVDFRFVGPDAGWLALALAVAGAFAAGAVLTAGRRRDPVLLQVAVLVCGAIGAAWVALAWQAQTSPGADGMPPLLWNVRFAAAIALAALLGAGVRAVPRDEGLARSVLAAVALTVTWVAGLLEVLTWVHALQTGWSRVAASLYTLAFAGVLLAIGFARRVPPLRWTGLLGFAAVAVKVVLFDLANVDTPLRVLATGAVGAVLLVAAYGYARTRRRGPEA
ncbi:MAG: DUF2339 domain-containing protein [Planctomycetes bacterium]|nr:DUF2339 domain-containing protein [Planctomycetota bacterium]